MHIVQSARRVERSRSSSDAVNTRRERPDAERVSQGNRVAVRVHMIGVIRHAELLQARQRLSGERLVELDHVELVDA